MYGALICNIALFFLEHVNSNKSLIRRAGSQNPNNHLCKLYLQNVSFWKVHHFTVFLIQHCGILSSQLLLGGPMRTRCACVGVLEGRQFISVSASRRVFANSAKPLQLLETERGRERECKPTVKTSTASTVLHSLWKTHKSHTLTWSCSNLLAPEQLKHSKRKITWHPRQTIWS